jgi:hypothetical protein
MTCKGHNSSLKTFSNKNKSVILKNYAESLSRLNIFYIYEYYKKIFSLDNIHIYICMYISYRFIIMNQHSYNISITL